MLFETSKTKTKEAELARQLKDHLMVHGIPSVASAKLSTWEPPMKRLIAKHGADVVELVISWYGPQATNPYIPMVRSARSLLEKFDRLAEMSGVDLLSKEPSDEVMRIITRRSLRFPVQRKVPSEGVWLQDAYEGIQSDLKRLGPRQRSYLGPATAVLSQWRDMKHQYACYQKKVESFTDLRYNLHDDTSFRIIASRAK